MATTNTQPVPSYTTCPKCGYEGDDLIRPSRNRTLTVLYSFLVRRPWKCGMCGGRFSALAWKNPRPYTNPARYTENREAILASMPDQIRELRATVEELSKRLDDLEQSDAAPPEPDKRQIIPDSHLRAEDLAADSDHDSYSRSRHPSRSSTT